MSIARSLAPDTLGEALRDLALWRGNDVALVDPHGGSCTFAEILGDCLALHRFAQGAGLAPSDRFICISDFGVTQARVLLARAATGCAMPAGSSSTEAEYELLISLGGARAICAWDTVPPALEACAQRLSIPCIRLATLPRDHAEHQLPELHHSDTAIIVWTSGSTSLPKRVPISQGTLMARGRKTQSLLAIDASDRCLCLMPLHYAHGINSGLLGPILCGGSAILPRSIDKAAFAAALSAGATWYTAGAAHQQAVLRWVGEDPGILANHRLRFVRSGSAALSRAVAESLERLIGAPVFESYSSSETGTMTANSPAMGRRPGTVGRSTARDVRVVDERGVEVPRGTVGEVVAGGECLAGPYEGDNELNASYRDGWFHTGDLGEMDGDGYLALHGRIKEQINRGGQKISPAELDACAMSLPGVLEAMAFPIPHPTLGEDVALAVVLQDGVDRTPTELLDEMGALISPAKLPRRVLVVNSIPRPSGNKVRRRDLAAAFGALLSAPTPASAEAGAKADGSTFLGMWRAALRNPGIGPEDDFFQHGGDSLMAMELASALGEHLGIEVLITDVIRFRAAKQFEDAWRSGDLLKRPNVSSFNEAGGRPPLFVFGGRYGHGLGLDALGADLAPSQPVHIMLPPGLDWKSAGCETVEQMAAHYIQRMRGIQPRGPYQVLGYSFGGLIAFEVARQLERAGAGLSLLFLVDPLVPTARLGVRQCRPRLLDLSGQLHESGSNTETMNRRVARQHLEARNRYVVETPFGGRGVLVLCETEPIPAGLDARRWWRRLAAGGMQLYSVRGSHGDVFAPQHRVALANLLKSICDGKAPMTDSWNEVFAPRLKLVTDAAGELVAVAGPGLSMSIAGRVPGQIDPARVAGPYLRVSGWAASPSGDEPARWLLIFLNGVFLGRVGTGRAVAVQAGGAAPPPFSGYEAHLPLRRPLPRDRPSVLRILVTHDGRTAYRL